MVDYVEEHISPAIARELKPGDRLVFVDPRPEGSKNMSEEDEKLLKDIDKQIVHVQEVSIHSIMIDEYPEKWLILRCFHQVIEPNPYGEEDLNAVFS